MACRKALPLALRVFGKTHGISTVILFRWVTAMGISNDQYTGLVQNHYFSNSPADVNAGLISSNFIFAQGGPFVGAEDGTSNTLLRPLVLTSFATMHPHVSDCSAPYFHPSS
jgi:hypothetical protein